MESWRPTKRHLQDSYQHMNKNSLIITLSLSAPGSLCLSLPTSQEALQFTSECSIGLFKAAHVIVIKDTVKRWRIISN